MSAATSRRSRVHTRASPSARWPRCSGPSRCSVMCCVLSPRWAAGADVSFQGLEESIMLTRRRFVSSVGLGAAGAVAGSWIASRGREDNVWSVFEGVNAQTPAAATAPPIILSSNENPGGPGKTVLDAIQAAFGKDGAAPGRYSNAQGALI